MNILEKHIIENYEYVIKRLKYGYLIRMDTVLNLILFKLYKDKIKNPEYYESNLINSTSYNDLELVI